MTAHIRTYTVCVSAFNLSSEGKKEILVLHVDTDSEQKAAKVAQDHFFNGAYDYMHVLNTITRCRYIFSKATVETFPSVKNIKSIVKREIYPQGYQTMRSNC